MHPRRTRDQRVVTVALPPVSGWVVNWVATGGRSASFSVVAVREQGIERSDVVVRSIPKLTAVLACSVVCCRVLLEVRPVGFEPTTFGSEDRCSIQLSYGRVCITIIAAATALATPRVETGHQVEARSIGVSTALRLCVRCIA
jgi:hypothetical protein